jgi:hypothetical protein
MYAGGAEARCGAQPEVMSLSTIRHFFSSFSLYGPCYDLYVLRSPRWLIALICLIAYPSNALQRYPIRYFSLQSSNTPMLYRALTSAPLCVPNVRVGLSPLEVMTSRAQHEAKIRDCIIGPWVHVSG